MYIGKIVAVFEVYNINPIISIDIRSHIVDVVDIVFS